MEVADFGQAAHRRAFQPAGKLLLAFGRLDEVVDELCAGVAGADAVDADSARGPFGGQAAGEVEDAGFGGVVSL